MLDTFNAITSLLDKGGMIAYLLAVLSIIALAIVIAKVIHFQRCHLRRDGFIDPLVSDIAQGKNIDTRLQNIHHPAVTILAQCLRLEKEKILTENARQDHIERLLERRLRDLQTGLPILEMIGNLAPLIGLLGTVVGMIESFSDLESESFNINVAQLAGGIWKALLTTAIGLSIAVGALVCHYFLYQQIERFEDATRDGTRAIADAVHALQNKISGKISGKASGKASGKTK